MRYLMLLILLINTSANAFESAKNVREITKKNCLKKWNTTVSYAVDTAVADGLCANRVDLDSIGISCLEKPNFTLIKTSEELKRLGYEVDLIKRNSEDVSWGYGYLDISWCK